jgi:cytochrome P450
MPRAGKVASMALTAERSLNEQLARLFSFDPDAIQNPYPVYDRLRDEAPVYDFDTGTVLVSRYEDVRAAYRDEERFPATKVYGTGFEGRLRLLSEEELRLQDEIVAFERNTISRKDGADHARVRVAAHRYFTPKRVADLEPSFQRLLDELLEEHGGEGVFDFMRVAYALPLYVITELLGVPREDAWQVKAWGDAITRAPLQNPVQPEAVRAKHEAIGANREYVRRLIEQHRADPDKSDLIASVLDARDGNRLTEDEMVAFFVHTLFAGHETTRDLIGNGLRALLLHREQWQLLCDDPSLVPRAVEEMLRWDSPVPVIYKLVGPDAELRGVRLTEGKVAVFMLAAANRDPDFFPSPGAFDVTRRPNDHVSLGLGPHFCLGASLARLEGRIVFETLTQRFPELDLSVDPTELRYHGGMRGLEALPVRLGR